MSAWRDPQDFALNERRKEERVRRLRARFARITRAYERAIATQRQVGIIAPAVVGLLAGAAIYFLIW